MKSRSGRNGLDACWARIGVWGDRQCPELSRVVHCRNCPIFSSAAAHVLDQESFTDYVNAWTERLATAASENGQVQQSQLIFRVGDEWLGLSPHCVREIAEDRAIHSLPHQRNAAVLGVVNVRGELLVCLSPAQVLQIGLRPEAQVRVRRLLVLERLGKRFVCPVDEVAGVFRVDENQQVAANGAKSRSNSTQRLVRWREVLLACLDESRLFQLLDDSLS